MPVDQKEFDELKSRAQASGKKFNTLLDLLTGHFESMDRFRNPGDPHRADVLRAALKDLYIPN
jgi:hypothetical protein